MRYTIACERCFKPAELLRVERDYKHETVSVNKVYKNTCECGGKIKAMME